MLRIGKGRTWIFRVGVVHGAAVFEMRLEKTALAVACRVVERGAECAADAAGHFPCARELGCEAETFPVEAEVKTNYEARIVGFAEIEASVVVVDFAVFIEVNVDRVAGIQLVVGFKLVGIGTPYCSLYLWSAVSS